MILLSEFPIAAHEAEQRRKQAVGGEFHNRLSALALSEVDEAVSNLDQQTAEHFAQTVNKLKGKVTILFITHQLPKGLQVDEAVILGKEKNANNEQEQAATMMQNNQKTSHPDKAEV